METIYRQKRFSRLTLAKQKAKLKKGGIALKSKGKAPGVQDLTKLPAMSTEDLMKRVVENANARAAGEE